MYPSFFEIFTNLFTVVQLSTMSYYCKAYQTLHCSSANSKCLCLRKQVKCRDIIAHTFTHETWNHLLVQDSHHSTQSGPVFPRALHCVCSIITCIRWHGLLPDLPWQPQRDQKYSVSTNYWATQLSQPGMEIWHSGTILLCPIYSLHSNSNPASQQITTQTDRTSSVT